MVDYTKVAVDAAKREMYGAQTAAADAARRGINGPIRDGVQVAREGLKRFMEGAGSFFSGGIWDTTTAKIGAATVAGGVAVTAAAGTALGGAKTAAETAVGQVADAAVGAAGVAQNFVANAATVTAVPVALIAGVPSASPAGGAAAATVDPDNPSRIGTDPATGEEIAKADKLVSPAVTEAQLASLLSKTEEPQKYADNVAVLDNLAAGGGDGQGVGTDVYQRAQNLFTMTGSFEQAAKGDVGKPNKPTVVHAARLAPKTPGLG